MPRGRPVRWARAAHAAGRHRDAEARRLLTNRRPRWCVSRLTAGSPTNIDRPGRHVPDSRDQARGRRRRRAGLGRAAPARRTKTKALAFSGPGDGWPRTTRSVPRHFPQTGPGPIGMVRCSESAGLVSRVDFLREGLGGRDENKQHPPAGHHKPSETKGGRTIYLYEPRCCCSKSGCVPFNRSDLVSPA
jgi:hypothetical protein